MIYKKNIWMVLNFTFFSIFKFIPPWFKPFFWTSNNMGLEKINLDIKMDFTNLKFEIWNIKNFEKKFLAWFFHLKCYGTSMCGGKKF
jgi:hypothetical protein